MNDGPESAAPINKPTRRQTIARVAMTFGGLALAATKTWAQTRAEISHTAESIHQEVVIKASPKRLYEALTDARQFERVVQLSDAAKTMLRPGSPPAQISSEAGGAFSVFGGLIVGRQIELTPDVRIVQAWRPAYWKPGVYSIVKIELTGEPSGTWLVLDHNGFPEGDAKSLLDGWKKNYWAPLAKYLG